MIEPNQSDIHPDQTARVAAGFLILLATLNVCSLLTERLLDWEEYRILENIDRPLREYIASNIGYGVYHQVSHKVSYTLFNESILGLRFSSILTAMISVVLAGMMARRILRVEALVLPVLFVFALGCFFLEYARWGIAGYSAATVFYLVTFYGFWKVSDSTLNVLERIAIVVFCAAGMFILIHTAIAIAIGPAAVLVTHFARSPRDWPRLRTKIRGLAYFAAYPLAIAAIYIPFIWLPWRERQPGIHDAENYRSYLYFRHNNYYAESISGAARFYKDHLYELIVWLFHPVGYFGGPVASALVILFFIGLAGTFARRQWDSPRFFVSMYVVVAVAALVLMNLLDLYPVGSPRYAFFLFFPVALLAAFGVGDIAWMWTRAFPRFGRVVAGIGAAGVCLVAAVLSVQEANRRLDEGERVTRLLGMIRDNHDLILVDSRYAAIVDATGTADSAYVAPLRASRAANTYVYDLEALQSASPEFVLTLAFRPDWNEYAASFSALAPRYLSEGTVELHPDPEYRLRFNKYNMRATTWRLADDSLRLVKTMLPVRTGVRATRDDGTVRFRGWVLAPQPLDRIVAVIGDREIDVSNFTLPRPDIVKAWPEYRALHPGFEFSLPMAPELEGKKAQFRFYNGEMLLGQADVVIK